MRNLHADEVATDEVSIALAPMLQPSWTADPLTWNPTGPVFDDAGNLYYVPFLSLEGVALVSLDPVTGQRRWTIPNTSGAPTGGGTPMVLDDPDVPGAQIVYVGLYDRVFAVRTDGSIVWDQPTGLPGPPTTVFGVNHHPAADAIVGLSGDGYLYAVDRRTGVSVLTAPYQLPGTVSPPGPPPLAPPNVLACVQAELAAVADLGSLTVQDLVNVLLGNASEVSNFFSIDPLTGRLWVGATAPDGEDGTVDGVSQLGALYHLSLVPSGPLWTIAETCHASFAGGTATTPALPRDGARVYVGDNVGNLLAIDSACGTLWSQPVGAQIFGSIEVAADNREVYAATALGITQVIDDGAAAHVGWVSSLDLFTLPAGQVVRNLNLTAIGANGLFFQAGAGRQLGATFLPVTTGVGVLDRLTGQPRAFTGGLDETVAVMSTGPDGALYVGNSPLRRAFMYCFSTLGILPDPTPPPVGGIAKFAPTRYDLFFRDVACAGADRFRNARRNRRACPAGYTADQRQLDALLVQARQTLDAGTASGDIAAAVATRLDGRLDRAEARRAHGRNATGALKALCRTIERALG